MVEITTINLLGLLKIFHQYLILSIQNWLSTKNLLNVSIINKYTSFDIIKPCYLSAFWMSAMKIKPCYWGVFLCLLQCLIMSSYIFEKLNTYLKVLITFFGGGQNKSKIFANCGAICKKCPLLSVALLWVQIC